MSSIPDFALGLEHDAISAECRLDAAIGTGAATGGQLRELEAQAAEAIQAVREVQSREPEAEL
jgi:hypothetical protein